MGIQWSCSVNGQTMILWRFGSLHEETAFFPFLSQTCLLPRKFLVTMRVQISSFMDDFSWSWIFFIRTADIYYGLFTHIYDFIWFFEMMKLQAIYEQKVGIQKFVVIGFFYHRNKELITRVLSFCSFFDGNKPNSPHCARNGYFFCCCQQNFTKNLKFHGWFQLILNIQ